MSTGEKVHEEVQTKSKKRDPFLRHTSSYFKIAYFLKEVSKVGELDMGFTKAQVGKRSGSTTHIPKMY